MKENASTINQFLCTAVETVGSKSNWNILQGSMFLRLKSNEHEINTSCYQGRNRFAIMMFSKFPWHRNYSFCKIWGNLRTRNTTKLPVKYTYVVWRTLTCIDRNVLLYCRFICRTSVCVPFQSNSIMAPR